MKHEQIKRLCVLAMLSALAYALVCVARIPISTMEFLKYEPKDVVITIGGFLYGPLAALSVSVVVSALEMVTISTTGWIGFAMNVISSAAFACTAAIIYHRRRTLSGAVIGLVLGSLLMTAAMLLWNYLITPIYMKKERELIAGMLIPVFLPFNLIKSGLNAAITALLYRPLVLTLRRARLLPPAQSSAPKKSKLPFWLGAAFVLLVCVIAALFLSGVL